MQEKKLLDFEQRLHGVALPTINAPLHKSLLRTALLAELQRTAKPRRGGPFSLLWALFSALRFHPLRLALPAALVVVAAMVWQGFFLPAETLAYATLHANPAVQLTVNTRGRVTFLTPLSPEAALLFANDTFRQERAELAVTQIVTRLHAEGFLRPDSSMVMLLRPAPAMPQRRVGELGDTLQGALENSLLATARGATMRRHTVSEVVYAGSRAAGLLPLDFVDLLETGLEDEDLISLFHLRERLPLDETAFRARFAAMARKMAREWRADMRREDALKLGQRLLAEELEDDESDVEDDDDATDRDETDNVGPRDNPRRDESEGEDTPNEDGARPAPGQGRGDNGRQNEDSDAASGDDEDDTRGRDPDRRPSVTYPDRENDDDREDDEEANGDADDNTPRGRGQGGE